MNRAEHLAWAKTRALEYVDRDDPENGLASMLSDLGKHEETTELAQYPSNRDAYQALAHRRLRAWIEGLQ